MELAKKKMIWVLEDDGNAIFVYEEALSMRYDLRFLPSVEMLKSSLMSDSSSPDLLIADLRIPGGSFLDFLSNKENAALLKAPCIVVSSVDDADILRYCFQEGVSDYLTKPFKVNELIVKLERHLTAPVKNPSLPFSKGPSSDLVLDSSALRLRKGKDSVVQLTAKEHQIFSYLYLNRDRQVSRQEVVTYVWNDVRVSAKTLDVHIFNLRKKIISFGLEIRFFPPHFFQLCETIGKYPGDSSLNTYDQPSQ